jgi:hypothetical protein
MLRLTPRTLLAVGFATTALLLASCSAKKTTETTVSTETTVAAADTTPVSVETTAVVAETTGAAEAIASETTAAAMVADTTSAANESTASSDSLAAGLAGADGSITEMLIGQMVIGMTGEKVADPADVKCISGKVPESDLTAIMSSTAGGDASKSTNAMKSLIKAVFICKPKGLADNFVKSTFTDMPVEVTDTQKSCLANGLFDLIGKDDAVVDAISANADKMPPALKSKFIGKVEDCVPAGPTRDALIKDIDK